MVDEIDEDEEDDNVEEVEEDGALLPLTCDVVDLEVAGWGNRVDGRPVKSEEAVVTGVAVEGCVGDEDTAPEDFWLLSAPLACVSLSWLRTDPPSLKTCLQISSVICIWWICLCCKTLSSSRSIASVGDTGICPCCPDVLEECC